MARAAGAAVLLLSPPASAHAWMLRHGYTGCATCHVDPSGAGILTQYGRVVAAELLEPPLFGPEQAESSVKFARVMPSPEWLLVSGDFRGAYLSAKSEKVTAVRQTFVMRADLEAAVRAANVVASASVGYAEQGALGASITRAPEKNLISREHWIGAELEPELGLFVRAGRMNLPFGLRIVEHTAWVRALTATSINDHQQYGVAVSLATGAFRAEVMGIAGNFQLRPDDYRERGASASVEWVPLDTLALGASTLHSYRKLHPRFLLPAFHHAGAVFARWVTPFTPLVVFTELDYEFTSPRRDDRREGAIGFVQLGLEAFRGLHLFVTGEAHNVGIDAPPVSYSVWVSPVWHFFPQMDLRLDNMYRSLGAETGRVEVLTLLAQLHVYL